MKLSLSWQEEYEQIIWSILEYGQIMVSPKTFNTRMSAKKKKLSQRITIQNNGAEMQD